MNSADSGANLSANEEVECLSIGIIRSTLYYLCILVLTLFIISWIISRKKFNFPPPKYQLSKADEECTEQFAHQVFLGNAQDSQSLSNIASKSSCDYWTVRLAGSGRICFVSNDAKLLGVLNQFNDFPIHSALPKHLKRRDWSGLLSGAPNYSSAFASSTSSSNVSLSRAQFAKIIKKSFKAFAARIAQHPQPLQRSLCRILRNQTKLAAQQQQEKDVRLKWIAQQISWTVLIGGWEQSSDDDDDEQSDEADVNEGERERARKLLWSRLQEDVACLRCLHFRAACCHVPPHHRRHKAHQLRTRASSHRLHGLSQHCAKLVASSSSATSAATQKVCNLMMQLFAQPIAGQSQRSSNDAPSTAAASLLVNDAKLVTQLMLELAMALQVFLERALPELHRQLHHLIGDGSDVASLCRLSFCHEVLRVSGAGQEFQTRHCAINQSVWVWQRSQSEATHKQKKCGRERHEGKAEQHDESGKVKRRKVSSSEATVPSNQQANTTNCSSERQTREKRGGAPDLEIELPAGSLLHFDQLGFALRPEIAWRKRKTEEEENTEVGDWSEFEPRRFLIGREKSNGTSPAANGDNAMELVVPHDWMMFLQSFPLLGVIPHGFLLQLITQYTEAALLTGSG